MSKNKWENDALKNSPVHLIIPPSSYMGYQFKKKKKTLLLISFTQNAFPIHAFIEKTYLNERKKK